MVFISNSTDLIKIFKSHENIDYIGIIAGTIVEINPYKISIYGGKAFFSGDDLYICKNVTDFQIPFSLTAPDGMVSGMITHEGVKVGDTVACVATEDNQKLFVIDKVVT